jgi:transcriptional regulator with XRE-family HTH domain
VKASAQGGIGEAGCPYPMLCHTQHCMTSNVVRGGVGNASRMRHNGRMAKERSKADRKPTFLKEWRKYRDNMSLDKAIERLELDADFPFSKGQLSRVERGEQPYSQDLLEALATIYRCESADLLNRDPNAAEEIWDFYDKMTSTQKAQATEVVKALLKVS